jgi:hypothetical protein
VCGPVLRILRHKLHVLICEAEEALEGHLGQHEHEH